MDIKWKYFVFHDSGDIYGTNDDTVVRKFAGDYTCIVVDVCKGEVINADNTQTEVEEITL